MSSPTSGSTRTSSTSCRSSTATSRDAELRPTGGADLLGRLRRGRRRADAALGRRRGGLGDRRHELGRRPGVELDLTLAAKVGFVLPLAIGLLAGGAVLLAAAGAMIYFGARSRSTPRAHARAGSGADGRCPSRRDFRCAGNLSRCRRGEARRRALPRAVARQMAARDPALRGALVPLGRLRRAHRLRVLRDPRDGALSRAASSISTSASCAGRGASASTRTPPWQPTATRLSRSTRCPTTRRRSRLPTPSGSRGGSCSSSPGCSRFRTCSWSRSSRAAGGRGPGRPA